MAADALLELRKVGDITGDFFVPRYQRGYRWGRDEVERLLIDIWESRDRSYYLQPVVVRARDDESWELIDGQQRLTTLYLIFKYMHANGLQAVGATYALEYETRPDSAKYLDDLDPDRSQENIDFFHISEAYRCIEEWFDSHGNRRQHVANGFYGALFDHVRVIWYEAPDDIDATALFTRLNVGRIPLTDAELVKALLLSRSRGAAPATDRAHEIAAQWDSMERDLRNDEVWAFVTASAEEAPTHISLLLDTLAGGPKGRDRPQFHTFETLRHAIEADPMGFWEGVVDLHSLVLGWYENRSLFHKIGFLVACRAAEFDALVQHAAGKRKSEFEAQLDELIRKHMSITPTSLRALEYGNPKASTALLLMNVETIRERELSVERYSFREHASGNWSLEHIHAQNAAKLNRAEQWATWLMLHRTVLDSLDHAAGDAVQDTLAAINATLAKQTITEADFRPLERRIVALLAEDVDEPTDDMNSIANLALLDCRDNSALSNAVFAVKRSEILERDRQGSYIPVCTRNVFLKYYTPSEEHQVHFWSSRDRDAYLGEMTRLLAPYMLADEVAA